MLRVFEVGGRSGIVFQTSGILVFYFTWLLPLPTAGTQLCPLQTTTQQGIVLSRSHRRAGALAGCTCCPELGERRGVSAMVDSAGW